MKVTKEELNKELEALLEEFHKKRIDKLNSVDLYKVLTRKNPYLFKAKGLFSVDTIIRSLLDATISSSEETLFGETMEKLAIYICEKEKSGKKSAAEGIDCEFEENGKRYIISIKSGPNWGNHGQIDNMKKEFKKAKKILNTTGSKIEVICVNGCCYGRDQKPDKGDYYKYCGQEFWALISGNENFYKEILEPFEISAKEKNEIFKSDYEKVVNRLSRDFNLTYCKADGAIDWNKILEMNSGKDYKKNKCKQNNE